MARLIYGTAYDGMIRFSVTDSKDVVQELRERHKLSYLPTVVLGRLISASMLVIPWLGERETITFVISGNGPAGTVVAQSTWKGTVRGYITNTSFELERNEFGKFDVKSAIGGGDLTVVRDVGLKTPFVSKVPIVSGEIAEDVAYYYTKSEQIPSAFALGVLMDKEGVAKAGGLAVQILDRSIPEQVISGIEGRLNSFAITNFLGEKSLEEIAKHVLGTEKLLLEEMNVVFQCLCSREKAFESLKVLDLSDLDEMLGEGKAEVTCKWCSTTYTFGPDEIKMAIEEKKKIESQES
ncbi:molecular chaperone Hsp33 [Fervidobacterium changbaicum]|uniref:33 kDa chaperonin n=1 Tax=Fervidobacterium changbaicum TaxID=310769 RepID=A0ABX5QTH4_9BACT|nr:Hsp33 family molecular chaperone HslO [Fervidobacterium changbaicum]QAV33729.1 Hsp33 family molecular chaperone HslO [Fervidobacterium changbaicum]SDH30934.1 molecular chaperone Hsp33 [Fervidobacterium changbaicum]